MIDASVMSLMESIQNPLLTDLMLMITHLVSYSVLFLVFILILFRKKNKTASNMLLGLLIEGTAVILLKGMIRRPRPSGLMEEFSYSLPSGHSSRSVFLALLFSNKWGKRIIWYSLAGLVMFSRLYLQVHYFTDILVGTFTGAAVYWLIRRYSIGEKLLKATKKRVKWIRKKIRQVFK